MRCLQIWFFLLMVWGVQGGQSRSSGQLAGVKPGSLLSMSTDQLSQVPAARLMLASLPATAGQAAVVNCSYSSMRAGVTSLEVRHFWYGNNPAWLSSVPAWNPIRKLIPAATAQCPTLLSQTSLANDGASAAAQDASARPPAGAGRITGGAALTATSFVTRGLTNERAVDSLYLGNFEDLRFNRDDTLFVALFEEYLEAFARNCTSALPANKVEMMRQRCVREQFPVNKYGARVGPSTCIEYTDEGTGLYADPDLYAAKTKLDAIVDSNALHNAIGYMIQSQRQGNPMAAANGILSDIQTSTADMNSLLRLNACTSSGLQRFQQNMMLFALGRQGLHLSSSSGTSLTAAQAATPAAPANTNQNYKQLLDDLITAQSKTWLFNRYVPGNVTGVSVSGQDASSRPSRLVGRYLFNGRSQGSVTVDFEDGLPQCMYFSDLPNSCKTPDRQIVSAFASGKYQR